MVAAYLPLLLVLVQGLEPGFLQADARTEPSTDVSDAEPSADIADAVLADAGVSDAAAPPVAVARPVNMAAAMKRAHALVHSARKAGPFNESHETMTPSAKFVCPYNLDGDYSAEEDHPEYNLRCAKLELLVNDVTDAEKNLNENVEAQRDARKRLKRMAHASKHGIAAEDPKIQDYQAKVVAETASQGLAQMIGGMWKEMRMFAAPSYSELLKERQAELSQEEGALRKRLVAAQAAVDDLKSQYSLEDAELVRQQADAWRTKRVAQPKAPKAAGKEDDEEDEDEDEEKKP